MEAPEELLKILFLGGSWVVQLCKPWTLDLRISPEFKPCVGFHARCGAYLKKIIIILGSSLIGIPTSTLVSDVHIQNVEVPQVILMCAKAGNHCSAVKCSTTELYPQNHCSGASE